MMIDAMDADAWRCMMNAWLWLILFQFDDFAFAGDAENFELIAYRVVLP